MPCADTWSIDRVKKYSNEGWPLIFFYEADLLRASMNFLHKKFDRNDEDNNKKKCSYKNRFDCTSCVKEYNTQGKVEYYEQKRCSWIRGGGKWAGRDKWAEIRAQHITDALKKL